MASDNENVLLENTGRRTRSGRQILSAVTPPLPRTRRASKRQAQSAEDEEHLELISAMINEVDNVEETGYINAQQQQIEDDVEMLVATDTAADEKSSSFPFGTQEHSETSDEAKDITVESSLLASLAGDNANSLPSVGGNDELLEHRNVNLQIDNQLRSNCVASSDDSISQPAIAIDLPDNVDVSDATIVNTEIISEDELPLSIKPEINDAEEVSDEELPSLQRAELPADAEVISEDELPHNNNNNNNPNSADQSTNVKRKAGRKREAALGLQTELLTEANNYENKKKMDEQYNPMSPTTESNDAPSPVEKKPKIEVTECNEKKKDKENEKVKDKETEKDKEHKRSPELEKYWNAVKDNPSDFSAWTYLLQYVDGESDAEAAREAYDTFLANYPYCYGYWRKYADYEKRKGIKSNCYAVFERGLKAIPLSVDLWLHYLAYVKSNHADDEEYIRKQFERAIKACGLEFRSDKLWEAYIRWESDAKRYHRVLVIYDKLLVIPTQGYSGHFDNFQDLINQQPITHTISNDELYKIRKELYERNTSRLSTKGLSRNRRDSHTKDKERDHERDDADTKIGGKSPKDSNHTHKDDAASTLNDSNESEQEDSKNIDLSDPSTLTDEDIPAIRDKVITVRRKLHKLTVVAVTARWTFEEGIKRPYFHVKPLERVQLNNWRDYLDFEIEKGDRKRILVLFERCLIACALYDEFWLKMLRYLETINDQPGVIEITRDVFQRACQIHHKDKPSLHLMWSAFEECQNNSIAAADILSNIDKRCPNILQIAYRRINIERRHGDFNKCRELYKHYIETAKNKGIAGSLAIKCARFLNKICHDIEGGLKVLHQTLEKDPNNTRVALQMIDLALQRAVVDEQEVVQIMDKFMARENIEPEQKVLFAQRKVEFLEDFGSTAKGLQDAQRALQLALSKANEAKKKRESSPSCRTSTSKETAVPAISTTSQAAVYNNGAAALNANYNYNTANSTVYYSQQNSNNYQQQSYDSYYNQWQYSSGNGGYNYGQWSGYGNYY